MKLFLTSRRNLQNTTGYHIEVPPWSGNPLRFDREQCHGCPSTGTLNKPSAFHDNLQGDIIVCLPRRFLEFSLAVHIYPSSLESQNATRREINSAVIEVVTNGELRLLADSRKLYRKPTKALQFFSAQTCPT